MVKDYLVPHKWRILFAFSANLVVAATTSLVPAMIQIATAFLIWIETQKTGTTTVESDVIGVPDVDTAQANCPSVCNFRLGKVVTSL